MKVFFDMEFTGLHQKTTPISIGCVSEGGDKFYAEFTDYDHSQMNGWIVDNVLAHLRRTDNSVFAIGDHHDLFVVDNQRYVAIHLAEWLAAYETVEMWGDCLAYDWVLFCELFGGAFGIPKNVHYIPRDLSTLLEANGVDPDVDRWQFSGLTTESRHNALVDAIAIRACHHKLSNR
jgi:hypothetical protein